MPVKLSNAVIDVLKIGDVEILAVRGVLEPTTISEIQVPAYQREILTQGKIDGLKRALRSSRVPEIDLGMRGSNLHDDGEGAYVLLDDVYVIDGLQRKTAARQLVAEGFMPHLGAIVHIDTTVDWERERFEALNVGQSSLSNNVMLKNLAGTCEGAKVLYDLTNSPSFVLKDRVAWTQNMCRGDLITAITFFKVAGRLHSHLGPGKTEARTLARTGLGKIISNTGKQNFTSNVRDFFGFLEEAYGVRNVAYRKYATQLKASFLLALAGVLSDHENFWDGNRLAIPCDLKKKLATFPLSDQYVRELAGGSRTAILMLEDLLIRHLNANKRTRRLRDRNGFEENEDVSNDDSDGAS
jgi:hypothetical protein